MARFKASGWHATDDPPEFADPFISELDLRSPHKGHVRYARFETPQPVGEIYGRLFERLLAPIISRYGNADSISIVFERSEELSAEDCCGIVRRAGGDCDDVKREPKGSDLLAIADYTLYATMKYVAQDAKLCVISGCAKNHKPVISSTVTYDSKASPVLGGHVSMDDRWYKMYASFVRGMSSVVEVKL